MSNSNSNSTNNNTNKTENNSSVVQDLTNSSLLQDLGKQNVQITLLNLFMTQISKLNITGGTLKDKLCSLAKVGGGIGFIFMVKYYLDNDSSLTNIFFSFLRPIFYRSQTYDVSDATKFDFYIKAAFDELKNTDVYKDCGFRITKVETKDGKFTLTYSKIFHKTYMLKLYELAQTLYQRYIDEVNSKVSIFKVMNEANVVVIKDRYYPCDNYVKLSDMITLFFEVSLMTNDAKVSSFLLQGIPGLGKTSFLEYYCSLNKCNTCRYVNMASSEYLTKAIEDIFKEVFNFKTMAGPMVFMIDELDKWMYAYLETAYDKYLREGSKTPEAGRGGRGGGGGGHGGGMDMMMDIGGSAPKEDKKTFVNRFKMNMLFTILEYVKTTNIRHSVVIIFCTNNFNTMFDDIDASNRKHHEALLTNLTIVDFKQCDKTELIAYLNYFNDKCKGHKIYIETDTLNKKCEAIRDNFQAPFREVGQLMVKSRYQLDEFIRQCNEYDPDKRNDVAFGKSGNGNEGNLGSMNALNKLEGPKVSPSASSTEVNKVEDVVLVIEDKKVEVVV